MEVNAQQIQLHHVNEQGKCKARHVHFGENSFVKAVKTFEQEWKVLLLNGLIGIVVHWAYSIRTTNQSVLVKNYDKYNKRQVVYTYSSSSR